MHWLSSHNRSEFLACPQLIRLDYAKGVDGLEPTLLIKVSTVLSKYIIVGIPTHISFAVKDNRLVYALKLQDDEQDPSVVWSIVERQEELSAIIGLTKDSKLVVFLFNELAINIAWNNALIYQDMTNLRNSLDSVITGAVDYSRVNDDISPLISELYRTPVISKNWTTFELNIKDPWNPVSNHYITSNAAESVIDVLGGNEGKQQENLGVWLTDSLHPLGCYHDPEVVEKSGKKRELTDIVLSYELGSFLIESKTLSIFTRGTLPNRAKLKKNLVSHISTAFSQLKGAVSSLKAGLEVKDTDGNVLTIERDNPAHAIVLIPDLDLVQDRSLYGIEFIKGFVSATGGIPHILDISELLRIVQAAEIISKRESSTPMMAFDDYLMSRFERAVKLGTLCIEVLLRLPDDE